MADRVSFLVEKVEKGIKVTIKGKPETEEVITNEALKASIGKAAYDYCERAIGPEREQGKKWAGLSNRLRKVWKS